METRQYESELLSQLLAHEVLALRGFSFDHADREGIIVERWGHFVGLWHFDGEVYVWTPAGYSEPTDRFADQDAAVRHTLVVISSV